jgi:hypothetical protein
VDVVLIGPAHLGGLWPRGPGQRVKYKLAWDVWQVLTPLTVAAHMDTTTFLSLILLLLFVVSISVLLSNIHSLLILEAVDNSGAAILLGGNIRCSDLITATVHGRIRVRFYQEVDTDLSLPCQAYESADSPHSPDPLTQDWREVADAALSATREVIKHFKRVRGTDEETPLYLFIQSVTMSTILHLFFQLPTTSTNIEDVVWIVGDASRADGCRQEPIGNPHDLYRLIKPSPNPTGMFALLSTMQRLILAAICTLEHRGENIQFIRRAGTLLRNPTAPDPDVTRLVEGVMKSHPPVQSVHGRLSLGCLPPRWTCSMDFLIPVDSLPPPACILGPDGVCLSWLHRAALPGPPACSSDKWLVRATSIILSAIETEIRTAQLTVDGDGHDPEAWEEYVLRRLRVG